MSDFAPDLPMDPGNNIPPPGAERGGQRPVPGPPDDATRGDRRQVGPPLPPPPRKVTPPPPVPDPTGEQEDARRYLNKMLAEWGLEELGEWAWQQILADRSTDEILFDLRQQEAYKRRFAGNVARQKAGYTPMSEAEYVAYEQSARQMMRQYGLPAGFYDAPEDFTRFIANDVSVSELNDRVGIAYDMAMNEPEDMRAFAQMYGVNEGAMTAYLLDPDRALPLLQQQQRAARAAGAGMRTGLTLSREQAERIGVASPDPAAGVASIYGLRGYTDTLQGEDRLTLDDLIGAQFGDDARAVERIRRKQELRRASFEGGGSFTTGGEGEAR